VGRLVVKPVDATLGAVVTGVDLRTPGPLAWEEILGAFHDYAVLVFPGQHLTPEEQRAFASRFGPISTPEQAIAPRSSVVLPRADLDHGAFDVANLSKGGQLVSDPDDEWLQALAGNFEWHTDSSYMPVSAQASMLTAHVIPDAGGETQWADMRTAYECLSKQTTARIECLSAFHSFAYAQSRFRGEDPCVSDHLIGAPLRPLVKVHPKTGRRALYVGRHAFGVPGLSDEESTSLLDSLNEFACESDRVYSHSWTVGDLVVWDNRAVLHRGRPWDFAQLRHLVHSRVAGDPVTEGAAAFG
jgi:alpha-ketoglutarate-dependent taurine dioxygenase